MFHKLISGSLLAIRTNIKAGVSGHELFADMPTDGGGKGCQFDLPLCSLSHGSRRLTL